MTLRVIPLPDRVSQKSSWQVKKDNVGMKSSHTHKKAAIRRARELARDGERVYIHDTSATPLRSFVRQRKSKGSR